MFSLKPKEGGGVINTPPPPPPNTNLLKGGIALALVLILGLGYNAYSTRSSLESRIGILVHWFSGGIESERIDLGPTTSVSLDGLSADMLLEMKEDALLEVCARSAGGRPRLRDAAEAAVRRRVGADVPVPRWPACQTGLPRAGSADGEGKVRSQQA